MKTLEELKNTLNLRVDEAGEDYGFGMVVYQKYNASVIWNIDGEWEHVSIRPYNKRITPSWEDMCRLKDMFFYDHEEVVQFHPPKNEYVNIMENCLHLWRPKNGQRIMIES